MEASHAFCLFFGGLHNLTPKSGATRIAADPQIINVQPFSFAVANQPTDHHALFITRINRNVAAHVGKVNKLTVVRA
ncbi:hypothetical protein D3C87_1815260 [compost metagenome]